MAIQYSSTTLMNVSFTQSSGTRTELVDWIKGNLVTAGWTVISGSSGNWTLKSAATPQSYQMRVQVYDPGSGNCARLKSSSQGGSITMSGNVYLLPGAGKVWRMVGSGVQAHILVPGSANEQDYGYIGVPYVYSFLTGATTETHICMGTSNTDTYSATVPPSWRNSLCQCYNGNQGSDTFVLYNANGIFTEGGTSSYCGAPKLFTLGPSFLNTGGSTTIAVKAANNQSIFHEAHIGYITSGSSLNISPPLVGELYDSFVSTAAESGDNTITYSGYTWYAITINNTGSVQNHVSGTLYVRVA